MSEREARKRIERVLRRLTMTYFPTRSSQNTCVRESALPWKFQRANSCQ